MQLKIISKQTILVIAVPSGFVLFLSLLFYFIPQNKIKGSSERLNENLSALSNQEQTRAKLPVRLKIPSINVDAYVEHTGLTPDGAMGVPKGNVNVAWYNLGPRPGENGSATIAGHYGLKNNIPSVFDDLHKLRVGDRIYIEDEKGTDIIFVVQKIQIYDKDEDASDVFSSNDEKSHLNLITCSGDWNTNEKTRSSRLVVFSDRE